MSPCNLGRFVRTLIIGGEDEPVGDRLVVGGGHVGHAEHRRHGGDRHEDGIVHRDTEARLLPRDAQISNITLRSEDSFHHCSLPHLKQTKSWFETSSRGKIYSDPRASVCMVILFFPPVANNASRKMLPRYEMRAT